MLTFLETFLSNGEETCISLEVESILGIKTFLLRKRLFQIDIIKEILRISVINNVAQFHNPILNSNSRLNNYYFRFSILIRWHFWYCFHMPKLWWTLHSILFGHHKLHSLHFSACQNQEVIC